MNHFLCSRCRCVYLLWCEGRGSLLAVERWRNAILVLTKHWPLIPMQQTSSSIEQGWVCLCALDGSTSLVLMNLILSKCLGLIECMCAFSVEDFSLLVDLSWSQSLSHSLPPHSLLLLSISSCSITSIILSLSYPHPNTLSNHLSSFLIHNITSTTPHL